MKILLFICPKIISTVMIENIEAKLHEQTLWEQSDQSLPELQIRRSNMDNSEIIFFISQ